MPYLCGVEKLVRSGHFDISHGDDGGKDSLLDWIYYNDIVGHFSLRHWDDNGKGIRILSAPPSIRPQASNENTMMQKYANS